MRDTYENDRRLNLGIRSPEVGSPTIRTNSPKSKLTDKSKRDSIRDIFLENANTASLKK
jgi:hypothetical protein